MRAVLDSWALLAHLQNEPAAGIVARYLGGTECLLTAVNYSEVLYVLQRRYGREAAVRLRSDLLRPDSPVSITVVTPRLAEAAAAIKAAGGMSLADAYAAGMTLLAGDGILLTGDPELRAGADRWGYALEWLGPTP